MVKVGRRREVDH